MADANPAVDADTNLTASTVSAESLSAGSISAGSLSDDPEEYLLVGISGVMGAGKDTVAAMFIEEMESRGVSYQHGKFATKLRRIVQILTGIPAEETHTDAQKNVWLPRWEMTVGQFLQGLGTEAIRDGLHPDAWVFAFESQWELDGRVPTVVSDVRFPNEADMIRGAGGLVIRVLRDDSTATGGRSTEHVSETALAQYKFDVELSNNGSLDDLRSVLKDLVDDLVGVEVEASDLAGLTP